MNRNELHDELTRLAELDHSPTTEQLAAFRKKATHRRTVRRSGTIGAACIVAIVIGGSAALAGRSSPSPRVVAPADSTPTSLAPSTPTTVTAIGDGVMLGAADPLVATIDALVATPSVPDVTTVDAVENRQFSDGIEVIHQRRDAGTLGQVVIVHLGTNGTVDAGDFDRMMGLLADREKVVVVNAKVPRPWEQEVNDTLAAGVKKYTNAVLLDWHEYGLAHPELFYDDGIHLRPEGADAYAGLVAAAVGRTTTGPEPTPLRTTSSPSAANQFFDDLPDFQPLQLTTGQVGYVESKLVNEPAPTTPDPEAFNNWLHTLVPVTAEPNSSSALLGYIIRNYGFVDLATAKAPGFDIETYPSQAAAKNRSDVDALQKYLTTTTLAHG